MLSIMEFINKIRFNINQMTIIHFRVYIYKQCIIIKRGEDVRVRIYITNYLDSGSDKSS